jgi:hypothetical protein
MANGSDINEEISGEVIPFYAIDPNEDETAQLRKHAHNILANRTIERINEANKQADEINLKWSKNFRIGVWLKRIESLLLLGLGVLIVYLGFSSGVIIENGVMKFPTEALSIILAGIGFGITAIYSLMSWEDDIYQMIVVARTNELQLFSDVLAIQTQLSFLRNRSMDDFEEVQEQELRSLLRIPRKFI